MLTCSISILPHQFSDFEEFILDLQETAFYGFLFLLSLETLDTLEKWVTEIFSEIPNK